MASNSSRRSGSSGSPGRRPARPSKRGAGSVRSGSTRRPVSRGGRASSSRVSDDRLRSTISAGDGSRRLSMSRDELRPQGASRAQRPSEGRTVSSTRSPRRSRRSGGGGGGGFFSSLLGRFSKVIVLVIVAIVVVLGLGFGLYQSGLFKVTSVEVSGNTHLTAQAAAELAAVPEGSTLLRYDADAITARLQTSPWVESVEIKRRFPHTLELAIDEREVGAIVVVAGAGVSGADEPWAVSADGIWLAPVRGLITSTSTASPSDTVDDGTGEEDWDDDPEGYDDEYYGDEEEDDEFAVYGYIPEGGGGYADGGSGGDEDGDDEDAPVENDQQVDATDAIAAEQQALAQNPDAIDYETIADPIIITGSALGEAPVAGEQVGETGISNAVEVMRGLSSELHDQVATIQAPTAEQTTLMLQNGVEVAFGVASNVEQKEKIVLQILAEHEGQVSYINVRVADRPTWRGLDN